MAAILSRPHTRGDMLVLLVTPHCDKAVTQHWYDGLLPIRHQAITYTNIVSQFDHR